MQLSPATSSVAPGTVLGTGIVKVSTTGDIQHGIPKLVNITAGETLMSGIRDVRVAAQELIRRTWEHSDARHIGLVGFVGNGDTFDAVAMLAPRHEDGSGVSQVWAPWSIAAFTPADDLSAVWQIAPYGGDARLRQPDSMFPPVHPAAS